MTGFHGKFVWYELMTSDIKAAESFYRGVVGWNAENVPGMGGMAYTLLKAGAIPAAGLMGLPKAAADAGMQPNWLGYIAVDDVDDYTARVKKDGGTIHRAAADIPGVGRFAIVSDPQGGVFALFKGSRDEPPPIPGPTAPGHTGWRELHTTDREAAFAFYARHFGWTKADAVDMGPMGVYQLIATGGETFGGLFNSPAAAAHPFWIFYFNVDAIDAAAARVTKGGGAVTNGPMEVPGGAWIVNCKDPQGAAFSLVAPKR